MDDDVEGEVETTSRDLEVQEKEPRRTLLPLGRIKKIMKADKDVHQISQEAIKLVGLATVSDLDDKFIPKKWVVY
jgi:hypothetical protein